MRPWDAFLTLANRDYDELMAKTTNSSINNVCINPPVVGNNNFGWTRTNDVAECQQGNTSQTTSIDNIVEEENVQFIKQIKSQAASLQKRPKRQIKLVHDRQKVLHSAGCFKVLMRWFRFSMDHCNQPANTIQHPCTEL